VCWYNQVIALTRIKTVEPLFMDKVYVSSVFVSFSALFHVWTLLCAWSNFWEPKKRKILHTCERPNGNAYYAGYYGYLFKTCAKTEMESQNLALVWPEPQTLPRRLSDVLEKFESARILIAIDGSWWYFQTLALVWPPILAHSQSHMVSTEVFDFLSTLVRSPFLFGPGLVLTPLH